MKSLLSGPLYSNVGSGKYRLGSESLDRTMKRQTYFTLDPTLQGEERTRLLNFMRALNLREADKKGLFNGPATKRKRGGKGLH